MIPFRELQNLCDDLCIKTQEACSVEVEHFAYNPGHSRLQYRLYVANQFNQNFKTVKELKAAIRAISDPREDVGVELSEGKKGGS